MNIPKNPSPSFQLGYSDAVKYGMPRNLRDFPQGANQQDYNAGYEAAQKKNKTKCSPSR